MKTVSRFGRPSQQIEIVNGGYTSSPYTAAAKSPEEGLISDPPYTYSFHREFHFLTFSKNSALKIIAIGTAHTGCQNKGSLERPDELKVLG